MPHRHVQVIVACSDHRMNPRIKQEIEQNESLDIRTIPIRTAGGDIRAAKETLKDVLDTNKVASVLILTHGDCKYRTARFESITSTGKDLAADIALPKAMKFTDISHFEKWDNDAILTAAKELVSTRREKYDITVEQVDISGIRIPEGQRIKHVLEVGRPEAALYGRDNGELLGRYMLSTTRGLDQQTGELVKFFVDRGIAEEVSFVSVEEEHRRNAELDARRLMLAPYMMEKAGKVPVRTQLLLRV